MPGLKAAEIDGRLEAAGIDKVYVFCVNDGAVMTQGSHSAHRPVCTQNSMPLTTVHCVCYR